MFTLSLSDAGDCIISDVGILAKLGDIRVTYSGLLGFVVAMGGILAGTAFTIIVTRQLAPEEYGVWAVIGSMTSYSIATEPIVSYWTTRQVARGRPVAKTSMASAIFFASGSIPVYLVSIYLFASIEADFFYSMLLASIMIPSLFIQGTLSAVNSGYRPHAVSIGTAALQAFKIPVGLALVFFLGWGLDGAILTVFVAHLANIAVQMRYARARLNVPLNFVYLKGWIRQSWMPMYSRIPGVLNALDIVLYMGIVGSVVGAAYFAAALVLTKMVSRASRVSQALYPKLLADDSRDHISENFTLVMYFAIPLLVLAILFSSHAMFLLNPEYVVASTAAVLLALGMFLHVIMGFIRNVLKGTDDVDVEERPSTSALLKSRLFLVGTVENVYYIVYLSILALTLYSFRDLPDPQLVVMWSSVSLAASIPFLICHVWLIRKHEPFRVPYGRILRHAAGGSGMVPVFLLTNEHIATFDVNISSYLPGLLLELAICCMTYIGITYAIDSKTRNLFKMVLSEIISRR